jgi:hypothetical protein
MISFSDALPNQVEKETDPVRIDFFVGRGQKSFTDHIPWYVAGVRLCLCSKNGGAATQGAAASTSACGRHARSPSLCALSLSLTHAISSPSVHPSIHQSIDRSQVLLPPSLLPSPSSSSCSSSSSSSSFLPPSLAPPNQSSSRSMVLSAREPSGTSKTSRYFFARWLRRLRTFGSASKPAKFW